MAKTSLTSRQTARRHRARAGISTAPQEKEGFPPTKRKSLQHGKKSKGKEATTIENTLMYNRKSKLYAKSVQHFNQEFK